MFDFKTNAATKAELYNNLRQHAAALFHDEKDFIANAANLSALLFQSLPQLNWAGIYRWIDNQLVLGPFQGKPACIRIALGKGVCGTAAAKKQTVLVPNVNQFPGHIACDHASQSEIVIPLLSQDKLLGVLDLDSPVIGRFDAEDQKGLESLACLLSHSINPL